MEVGETSTSYVYDCMNRLTARPIIVLQKLSVRNAYGHYRVVVGHDDEKELMTTAS